MRHRDRETVADALEDWRNLRKKVATAGGENYEKPVLVKFLDTGTFEVMERDIVEDEFYVLREHKILRELAPDGRDLEAAIREAGRDTRQKAPPRRQGQPPQKGQPSRRGQQSQKGQSSQKAQGEKRGPRRGRRRGRRTGKSGPRSRDRGGPPPAA